MDTRKVEVTEERLLDGASEYLVGDIKTLPKAKADQWVALGWAKCVETGEQGERKPGASPIKPDNVSSTVA
jgi:hypothetical protein